MKIVIRWLNFEVDREIEDFVKEKINSLERFAKDIFSEKYWNGFFGRGKPKVEAWVELGKETRHHKKGPVFYAECQMRFPGKSLRATSTRENLKKAINEVKEEIERQMIRYKEKLVELGEKRIGKLKLKKRVAG